ncbi:Uncharacterised protein [Mycobacteroides abscessus subsp. abscessus]|nr:Uncharacterised protein [Mycobacteroides abscessus subsp. abscessus]
MLADVAEEVDRRDLRRPVVVVDDAGGVRSGEVEEAFDLGADLADPFLDDLARVERALPRHPRVADEAGGPADERERIVPGLLEAGGRDELDEVAHVQARRGRIETDVIGQRLLVQSCLERGLVGRHRHEPAGFEVTEYVGHFGPFETVWTAGFEPALPILRRTWDRHRCRPG